MLVECRVAIGVDVGSQPLCGVQGHISFEVDQAVNSDEQRQGQQRLSVGGDVGLTLHDVCGARGSRRWDIGALIGPLRSHASVPHDNQPSKVSRTPPRPE
jgi:hypothetical protein